MRRKERMRNRSVKELADSDSISLVFKRYTVGLRTASQLTVTVFHWCPKGTL